MRQLGQIGQRAVFLALTVMMSGCGQEMPINTDDTQANPTANPHTHIDHIKARQDLMYRWGKSNKVLKNMAKNPATFDKVALQAELDFLAGSQAQMWAYFKDNTPHNRVNALIHANDHDYQAHIEAFDRTLKELTTTVHSTDDLTQITPHLTTLNETCKACHHKYKKL